MSMITDRQTLDRMTCSHANHDDGVPCDGALYFHSRCHPDKPTWAIYQNGTLRIECAKCKDEIVTVSVAG